MSTPKKKYKYNTDYSQYGNNVRIPPDEYQIIKEYTKKKNYKLGNFIATAAVEKIGRLKRGAS